MNVHASSKTLLTSPDTVTTGPITMSRKIYTSPKGYPGLRVPFREIALGDPKQQSVRVYDPSGPYTGTDARIDLKAGLPPVRESWMSGRGFGTIEGREVRPEDNGNVGSERLVAPCPAERTLRAGKPGALVTQYEFARAGLITGEMVYVAHRENLKITQDLRKEAGAMAGMEAKSREFVAQGRAWYIPAEEKPQCA